MWPEAVARDWLFSPWRNSLSRLSEAVACRACCPPSHASRAAPRPHLYPRNVYGSLRMRALQLSVTAAGGVPRGAWVVGVTARTVHIGFGVSKPLHRVCVCCVCGPRYATRPSSLACRVVLGLTACVCAACVAPAEPASSSHPPSRAGVSVLGDLVCARWGRTTIPPLL